MKAEATEIVHPGATVDPSVEIGAYSVIHENVEIGKNCVIGSFVELNHAKIGSGTRIGSHSIIGGDPQMLDWDAVESIVRIGEDNDIREMVTIHRSANSGGETLLGDRNMIMTNTHIGHDCIIGNDAVMITYSGLSGHVTIDDFAMIGGNVGVHQHVRIGESVMVGGMSRIAQDVAPYMMVQGNPATVRGTNAIGLKRRSVSPKARSAIKEAYKILFRSGLNLKSAIEKIGAIEGDFPELKVLLDFVSSSKRGLTGA